MQGTRTVLLLAGIVVLVVVTGLWFGLDDREEDPGGGDVGEKAPPAGDEGRDGFDSPIEARADGPGRGRLTGRLVLLSTGKPVPGVVVRLTRAGSLEKPAEEVSGEDGRFTFSGAPAGEGYEVAVSFREFATLRLPGLMVVRGEVTDVGTVYLERAVSFVVRVVAGGGAPIPDADVEIFPGEQRRRRWDPESWMEWAMNAATVPTPLRTGKAGPDGEAAFSDIPGGYYHIVAGADGYARAGVRRLLTPDTAGEAVTIVLGRGYTLRGVVRGPEGAEVRGRVLASPGRSFFGGGGGSLRRAGEIGEEGEYLLDRLAPGTLRLSVDPEGGSPVSAGAVEVPRLSVYDILLGETAVLTGKVADEAGKPVANAEVRIMLQGQGYGGVAGSVAVTGEDGAYRIEGIPPGTISRLEVLADGFARYPTPVDRRPYLTFSSGSRLELDIVLRRGGELTGTVSRASGGGPIAGVKITVTSSSFGGGTASSTTSGSDGRYSLAPLAPGRYSIRAVAEGFYQPGQRGGRPGWPGAPPGDERWTVEIAEGAARTVKDLTLEKGGVVAGRVEDTSGEVVSGARVSVRPGGSREPVFSAKDGTFQVAGLPPGDRLMAFAWMPGRWARCDPFSLSTGGKVEGLRLVLKAAATISGRVVLASGDPPEGGTVSALSGGGDMGWGPGSSDAPTPIAPDGRFRLEEVPPGKVRVAARVPGYSTARSDSLTVPEGGEVTGVVIEVPYGLTISGRVTLSGGGPVEDASIHVRETRGFRGRAGWGTVAQTDDQGRFEVGGFPPGKYRVTATKAGLTTATRADVNPETDGPVSLEMGAGNDITGRVTDEKGSPVGGMYVSLSVAGRRGRPASFGGGSYRTTTSADGTFKITGVRDAVYDVHAKPTWGSTQNYEATTVAGVRPGESVEIRVRPGLRITGRVLDPEGRPAVGRPVQLQGGEPRVNLWSQTASDGTFEAVGLSPGVYTVSVRTQGRGVAAATLANVSAGTEDLRIALEYAVEVSGRVFDPDGAAAPNVSVRAEPSAGGPGARRSARSGADGAFRISNLTPGAYTLRFTAPGRFAPLDLPDVAAGTEGITVTMERGLTLSGVVLARDGRPLGRVVLQAQMPGGQRIRATSNEEGVFRFGGLAEGKVAISVATSPEGHILEKPVQTEAGKEDLKIVLTEGLTIRGRVVDDRGAGIARAWVAPATGRQMNTRTETDGSFKLVGLGPGEVKIRVYVSGRMPLTVSALAGDQAVLIRME